MFSHPQIEQINFENYVPRPRQPQEQAEPIKREEPHLPKVEYTITYEMGDTEEKRLNRLTEFLDNYDLLPEIGRTHPNNVAGIREKIRDFYRGKVGYEKEEGIVSRLTSTNDQGKYIISTPPTRVAEILDPKNREAKRTDPRRIYTK